MVHRAKDGMAGTVTASGGIRRSSREHRANQPANLCCDRAALRQVVSVFLCRACQSVLGDSGSLVAAYSLHGPSNIYSSTLNANKRTMVALRATTRNVVRAEDGELSCACGAALGRAVDHETHQEGAAQVLNGSFQLDTSSLIRYRLGVDADVVMFEGGDSEPEGEAMDTERGGPQEMNENVGRYRDVGTGSRHDNITRQHDERDVERRHRRESTRWDDTVRDALMDLKRRVRALESNFNHHDRELTDHFNAIRNLESAVRDGR